MLRFHAAAPAWATRVAWAAVVVLTQRSSAVVGASSDGWPFDGFGARYGEGLASGGYAGRFTKGFGDGFGQGLYGNGFGGYRLGRYGDSYGYGGYGGKYGYGGDYKDRLKDWPGSLFEGFPFRMNAPAKYSTDDANLNFMGAPKYFAFGDDYFPGDKLGHNEFSDGEKVVGVYTLKEPGGNVRTVKYIADDTGGFQATIVNDDGDFNGAAYGNGYGHGPVTGDSSQAPLSENIKSTLDGGEALHSWGGWADGGGGGGGDGGGGGGVSWHGSWGRWSGVGAGPYALVGGYAVHEQPEEGYF